MAVTLSDGDENGQGRQTKSKRRCGDSVSVLPDIAVDKPLHRTTSTSRRVPLKMINM